MCPLQATSIDRLRNDMIFRCCSVFSFQQDIIRRDSGHDFLARQAPSSSMDHSGTAGVSVAEHEQVLFRLKQVTQERDALRKYRETQERELTSLRRRLFTALEVQFAAQQEEVVSSSGGGSDYEILGGLAFGTPVSTSGFGGGAGIPSQRGQWEGEQDPFDSSGRNSAPGGGGVGGWRAPVMRRHKYYNSPAQQIRRRKSPVERDDDSSDHSMSTAGRLFSISEDEKHSSASEHEVAPLANRSIRGWLYANTMETNFGAAQAQLQISEI